MFSLDKPDVIIVNDAVRPFFDSDLLRLIVKEAFKHGAAGPVCKLSSTVLKVADDGFLDHALERSQYRASEMPQAFQCSLIVNAYQQVRCVFVNHSDV